MGEELKGEGDISFPTFSYSKYNTLYIRKNIIIPERPFYFPGTW